MDHLVWTKAEEVFAPERAALFDGASHAWRAFEGAAPEGRAVTAADAVALLIRHRRARRLPVGVIGPNDASAAELAMAEAIGAGIAALGLPLICGGRGGCMEAASRGANTAGGFVIGILPSNDWLTANTFVDVPVASGIGEARNAIIASACFALVAVGGGHGTLSEMALGLKMGRRVIAMPHAERVTGALACSTPEAAVAAVAERYLVLDHGAAA
jgi:uncharacterized protein (TIGR00725 family)